MTGCLSCGRCSRAVQARQIQQTLTTTAQQLGASDARSMDQRRADTLVDLLLGRAEPATVDVQVIVAADTLTGACAPSRAGCPAWDRSPPTRSPSSSVAGTRLLRRLEVGAERVPQVTCAGW